MRNYMNAEEMMQYAANQRKGILMAMENIDPTWIHAYVVKTLLEEALEQLEAMPVSLPLYEMQDGSLRDRKTEKYTNWLEVYRLALFQYERFTERRRARSEGLYSTLLSLASVWGDSEECSRILIPGCGPGRSVLDFARAYPDAKVTGLDYSLLSLILGEKVVCGVDDTDLLRRDVLAGEAITSVLKVRGFGLSNAEFALCDLVTSELPKCDMIVCSNTLNLLPDHQAAVKSVSRALRPGGLLIFADLVGWRMDRMQERRLLRDDCMIRKAFEEAGLCTMDSFSGVPYIEAESDDQETHYNEHFYVGRKRG